MSKAERIEHARKVFKRPTVFILESEGLYQDKWTI